MVIKVALWLQDRPSNLSLGNIGFFFLQPTSRILKSHLLPPSYEVLSCKPHSDQLKIDPPKQFIGFLKFKDIPYPAMLCKT